jgi:hypothetical protein
MGRQPLDAPAAERDVPTLCPHESGERVHERRLAGAVRPEQRHHLPLLDAEARAPEDLLVRAEDVEAVGLQQRTAVLRLTRHTRVLGTPR